MTGGELRANNINVGGYGDGHIEISGGTLYADYLWLASDDSGGGWSLNPNRGGTMNIECDGRVELLITEGSPPWEVNEVTVQYWIDQGWLTNAQFTVENDSTIIITALEPLVGDLNDDCHVDFKDFAVLASYWQQTGIDPALDLFVDDKIDLKDFDELFDNWLAP
jgi:hypothetical protein